MARTADLPSFIADRRWWLLPLLAWALIVGLSFHKHLQELEEQSIAVAAGGARNMFRMILLTRTWSSQHGGVYLPVTETLKPNPYLQHPRRDLTTTDGQRLTMINPAYMTRLLSELAEKEGVSAFRITSLKPTRPGNAPDDWERTALGEFDAGRPEKLEIIDQGPAGEGWLRYMAPLKTLASCLACHAEQGYEVGDIRGGISVTLPLAPIRAASIPARQQSLHAHLAALLLVSLCGGLLLELLRHRWLALAQANAHLSRAKAAAEQANVAKTAFLANISHELRTPLNAIVGYTHLLRGKVDDKGANRQIDGIENAAGRLLAMFSLIFDTIRAETGELQIADEAFELGDFAEQLHAHLARECAGKGLASRLEMQPDAGPCWLRGDTRRLSQLLRQYIDNAVKFSERGEIALRVSRVAHGAESVDLRFEVVDQGIGIDAAHQQSLFGLFQQIDASATRRHGGNGAGLYLCRKLAELMGGSVGVDSAPGRGSCFWFAVTQAAAADGRPATPPQASPLALADSGEATEPDLPQQLDTLARLLADDDFAVLVWWREHAGALRGKLGDEDSATLEASIHDFRFDVALALLRRHLPPAPAVDRENP